MTCRTLSLWTLYVARFSGLSIFDLLLRFSLTFIYFLKMIGSFVTSIFIKLLRYIVLNCHSFWRVVSYLTKLCQIIFVSCPIVLYIMHRQLENLLSSSTGIVTSWSWSYGGRIYNYLWNGEAYPIQHYVMKLTLSVIWDRSVIFSGYSDKLTATI